MAQRALSHCCLPTGVNSFNTILAGCTLVGDREHSQALAALDELYEGARNGFLSQSPVGFFARKDMVIRGRAATLFAQLAHGTQRSANTCHGYAKKVVAYWKRWEGLDVSRMVAIGAPAGWSKTNNQAWYVYNDKIKALGQGPVAMAGDSSSTANIAKGLTQRGSKNNVIDAKHAERTLPYYINYIKFFEETDFKRHHDEEYVFQ